MFQLRGKSIYFFFLFALLTGWLPVSTLVQTCLRVGWLCPAGKLDKTGLGDMPGGDLRCMRELRILLIIRGNRNMGGNWTYFKGGTGIIELYRLEESGYLVQGFVYIYMKFRLGCIGLCPAES